MSGLAEQVMPKKNERFINKKSKMICRVMCDSFESYVVFRYKGCYPVLLHIKDFREMFARGGVYER